MATTGKLELTIKISELPEVKTVENGLQYFILSWTAMAGSSL